MSRVGRIAAVGALVFGALAAGSWTSDGDGAGVGSGARPAGADLFRAKGCAQCHTGPGLERTGVGEFPPLGRAPEWAGTRRPGMSAAQYLREPIIDPSRFRSPAFGGGGPTPGMPGLRLTTDEVEAIVAYLLEQPSG